MSRFSQVKKANMAYPHIPTMLPMHQTYQSAGVDFHIKEEVVLPPFERTMVFTDVKCKLKPNEVLLLVPRSSIGIKKGIMLSNTTGVIDADYFGNEANDGNIGLPLFNTTALTVTLKAGERVAQGIILNFVQGGEVCDKERVGGTGHTGN